MEGAACPILKSIGITECIRKSYLRLSSSFLLLDLICSINCSLKVSDIIKTVEYSYNIDTVCNRLFNESINNIICVRTISEDILSTEEHLKFCVLESVAEFS